MKFLPKSWIILGGMAAFSYGSEPVSYELFQALTDQTAEQVVEAPEPIMHLAGKKRNNRRGFKQPKPVKINAASTRTISLQEKSRDRLDGLGSSDSEVTEQEQTAVKVDRFVRQQMREAKYLSALRSHLFGGSNVNAQDAAGRTYLHLAVLKGYAKVASYLIEQGADASLKDHSGMSPLDLARTMKLDGMVALLKKAPKAE